MFQWGRGGILLVQMITTCLRIAYRKGGGVSILWSQPPKSPLLVSYSSACSNTDDWLLLVRRRKFPFNHTPNRDREKSSGQTHLFNIGTNQTVDGTTGKIQVKLSLLHSKWSAAIWKLKECVNVLWNMVLCGVCKIFLSNFCSPICFRVVISE
jgi:hypothetical protein